MNEVHISCLFHKKYVWIKTILHILKKSIKHTIKKEKFSLEQFLSDVLLQNNLFNTFRAGDCVL